MSQALVSQSSRRFAKSDICVPILPNQTHVQIFKNDIFAFYVSIHPYETEKKVW